jgi:hypothetical protein
MHGPHVDFVYCNVMRKDDDEEASTGKIHLIQKITWRLPVLTEVGEWLYEIRKRNFRYGKDKP